MAYYRALDTQEIEGRIAIGGLTAMAREVATAELRRRDPNAQEPEPMAGPPLLPRQAPSVWREEPGGWSLAIWALVYALAFVVAMSAFGATRSRGDEGLLFGILIVAAAIATLGINRLVRIFTSGSLRDAVKSLIWLVIIGVVLFYLTLCSVLVRYGWGG